MPPVAAVIFCYGPLLSKPPGKMVSLLGPGGFRRFHILIPCVQKSPDGRAFFI
ncbi:branched-chain amino acid ABC superfamily ATP binding cassette transporter, ABC protein [Desmospora sp. 8437]|nr:branched-chain amino acid ABC superfamily ATP binding cassette transporter, ABC protein [Desmospora sp. 8437]